MPSAVLQGLGPTFVSNTNSDAYSKLRSYLQLRRMQIYSSPRFITASRIPTLVNRPLSKNGPGRMVSVPIPPSSNSRSPRTRILVTEESGSLNYVINLDDSLLERVSWPHLRLRRWWGTFLVHNCSNFSSHPYSNGHFIQPPRFHQHVPASMPRFTVSITQAVAREGE